MPHQIERLEQLSRQASAARQSEFKDEFGVAYALADRVGLTTAEKAKLKEATIAARKNFYAELRELKQETHERILSSLPKEKRGELTKLIGDRLADSDARNGR